MEEQKKRDFKILIVEDDIVDAKLLKRQLTQTSLNITRVAHTERLEESLAALKQEQFDIVLLDMNLPDSNGLDTLQRLHKEVPEVPIINVTGSTDEEMGLRAVSSGAQDYLVKGRFDPYILNKSIQYAIERKKMEEQTQRSEERYRQLFESSRDALAVIKPPSWKFASGNAACLELFQAKDLSVFTSLGPWELSPERQPDGSLSDEKARELIEIAMREGSHYFEWAHSKIGGDGFPAAVLLTKMELDGEISIHASIRDITARKQAEEALRSERDFAESLLDTAQVIILMLDAEGRIIRLNPYMEEISGYSLSEVEGKDWFSTFLPEKDRTEVRNLFKKAISGLHTKGNVNTIVTKDGKEREIEWYDKTLKDADGNVMGLLAVGMDVTDRRKAAKELQEERNKLRSLVDLIDNMDAGITVQDTDYNIIYQNPFMQKQFGGLGGKCYKVYEGRDKVCDGCPVAKAFTDGQLHSAERTTPAPGGGVLYWANTAHPIRDINGKITSCFEVVKNITDQKRAEQELRENKGKLDAMLSSISDDMTMLDQNLTIIWANSSAKEKFGSDIVGKKCYQAYHGNADSCPKSDCALRKAFETGTVQRWDSAVTDAKGNARYFHSTANVAIRDSQNQPVAVLQISRDITDEKNAENALVKANKELENANKGLKQMQGQLVQNEKLASIGQLAAGVAHEMNTPVGFVASNFATLRSYFKKFKTLMEIYNSLIKDIQAKDSSICTDKIAEIEKSWKTMKIDFICGDIECLFNESKEGLERVTSIIQNLRDFSRIDQAENLAEYDLNSGIKATLIVARNELKYDADIKTDFCESLPVHCNSGQVNQVFLNILVNAAHAIKSQKKEEKGTIEIKTYIENDWAVCAIKDNGPGIPQEIVTKIFDPFFTTKPAGKGTGLGLSVSHDIIVNKHKGLIEVESEIGKGTTFYIKLPLRMQADKSDGVLAETGTNGK